jgi:hypothetical protein
MQIAWEILRAMLLSQHTPAKRETLMPMCLIVCIIYNVYIIAAKYHTVFQGMGSKWALCN